MVAVIVDGKEYNFNEQQVAAMKYIEEAEAIEKGSTITIKNIDQKTFEFVLEILQKMDYDIQEPPKLKNNILEDHISKNLAALIGGLTPKEINGLYRAVHYLKIYALRKCIAAVMACRVFIEPTLENYNKKKDEIGLKEELTTEKSREYKDRFPFMN